MTQGRRLIAALKRPHTYLEMNMLGISVAPHMRIVESLLPGEQVVKGSKLVNGRKLVTWRVVKATKWTA